MPYTVQPIILQNLGSGLTYTGNVAGFPASFDNLLVSAWVCLGDMPRSVGILNTVSFMGVSVTQTGVYVQLLRGLSLPVFNGTFAAPIGNVLSNVIVSVNLPTQTIQVCHNNTLIPMTSGPGWTDSGSFNPSPSPTYNNWNIGGAGSAAPGPGIADLYIGVPEDDAFYDLNLVANRRKFINGNLTPVDLGTEASSVLGSSPPMYLTVRPGGVPNDFGINNGAGGPFTISVPPLAFQAPGTCVSPEIDLACLHSGEYVRNAAVVSPPEAESQFSFVADLILSAEGTFALQANWGGLTAIEISVGWITGGGPDGGGPGYGVTVRAESALGGSFMTASFGPLTTPPGTQFHIEAGFDTHIPKVLRAFENGVELLRYNYFPGSGSFDTLPFDGVTWRYGGPLVTDFGCSTNVGFYVNTTTPVGAPYIYLDIPPSGVPADFLSNDDGTAGAFIFHGATLHLCSYCTGGVEPPAETVTLTDAELVFQPGAFLDLSVESNRRLFVATTGTPAWLDHRDGSLPFGEPPAVYLTTLGPPRDFTQNNGDGGAFPLSPGDEIDPAGGPGCTIYYFTESAGAAGDPQWRLSVSDDGSRTWSRLVKPRSMGPVGHYKTRLRWLKMGQFRQRVMKLESTDPVRKNIIGIYIDLDPGMA